MLISIVLILLIGFGSGRLAGKLGAPPLIGMILAGIVMGEEIGKLISPDLLSIATDLRAIAVMVILMRAGLGLDRDKLVKQGSVAIRLGFLPALTEAIAVAIIAMFLFKFNFITGLLLGCVVSAESPAVIVPGMLRLKSLGWGVSKGIPDVILTGSALSDVLVLLLFSLLVNFLVGETVNNYAVWLLPFQVVMQIVLGVVIGYLTAKLIILITVQYNWTQNRIHNTLITAGLALLIISLSQIYPYFSGYLATMAMGFFLIEFDPPLARQLRIEFNYLWIVAEIILFVLMGATIQLKVLETTLSSGILLLMISLLFGRTIGWYLATLGSDWNWKEKLFLLPGNSAKATVQAAIGAIPLSLGIPGGDIILAIAALSILITAPLGAWAIPTFAPKLLTKDPVDPTKVAVTSRTIFLAVINQSNLAEKILTTVGDFARRSNGEVIVLDITKSSEAEIKRSRKLTSRLLLDIRHQFITNNSENALAELATRYQVNNIILNKEFPNQISDSLVKISSIPITFI